LPKRRGGHEKITWGLEREGGAPEKRIGGEGRAPVGRSGGGVVEEWRSSGERCGLERELGASYIGMGEEWRGRG
jgi:hypothetical protein